MNLQTSVQSPAALSGIPLIPPTPTPTAHPSPNTRPLLPAPAQQPCSASFDPTSGRRMICAAKRSLPSHFVGVWMSWRSSVFISRPVTAARWSVSPRRPAGTVGGLTETDRRWSGDETCHRLTRLPAGGLRGTICFSSQQIIFLINL